ncbi:MAG: PilZ domain-containing protein [Oligoflexales bacterium]|nr:PilZ domain-containing protein [Oligoflexales bacterium]
MTVNQRQHFRIQYPTQERAQLNVNGSLFPIIDLSQSGLKFQSDSHYPSPGQVFLMTVIMLHGYQHNTKMKVVRVEPHYIMMIFEHWIEKYYIEEEKNYLEKQHGKFSSAGVY